MSPIPHRPIPFLTVYGEEHIITYLRLLDANAEGADWREVTRIALHLIRTVNRIGLGRRSKAICCVQMDERARLSATAARWRVRLRDFKSVG
jgi:hypothetical protein